MTAGVTKKDVTSSLNHINLSISKDAKQSDATIVTNNVRTTSQTAITGASDKLTTKTVNTRTTSSGSNDSVSKKQKTTTETVTNRQGKLVTVKVDD